MKTKSVNLKKFLKENLFIIAFILSAMATFVVSAITLMNMNNTVMTMNSAKETSSLFKAVEVIFLNRNIAFASWNDMSSFIPITT